MHSAYIPQWIHGNAGKLEVFVFMNSISTETLEKKELLIILGAGSSVDQKMPSVADLGRLVSRWASEWATESKPNYYHLLCKNRTNYYAVTDYAIQEQGRENYEQILGDMHSLLNASLVQPFGNPVLQWFCEAEVFKDINISGKASYGRPSHFHAVESQLIHLYEKLANHMRGAAANFEYELHEHSVGESQFAPYRQIFDELQATFSIGVYNLNYDTVALNAMPGAFFGFDAQGGKFSQSDVLLRSDWDFIYHLHGSVHHTIGSGKRIANTSDFGQHICWRQDTTSGDYSDTETLREGTDQRKLLRTSLVTGSWKLDQMQEDPFSTFYSLLPRHMAEADGILIGGYGFSDHHINTVLTNALRFTSKRPPVVVLDWENPAIEPEPMSIKLDKWTSDLGRSLSVDPTKFLCKGKHITTWDPPQNLSQERFEVDRRNGVAVWRGGFNAARSKIAQIASWLAGDYDSIE